LRQSTALDILHRPYLPCESLSSFRGDRPLFLSSKLFDVARVFPKIRLGTYDEEGNARAVVSDFRDPFF
jgi:hypothetical protein